MGLLWQGSSKDILPSPDLCVVVHGDDFTFEATESELGNMQSRMCIVRRHGALHCWQVALLVVENVTCSRLRYWEEV